MKFPWARTGPSDAAAPPPENMLTSPTLEMALRELEGSTHREVLYLGPLCGDSVVFVADRGGRVTVEDFTLPAAEAASDTQDGMDEAETPRQPMRINQPDGQFHLILAWEHLDFIPPDRIDELTDELRRVLAPGGALLVFSLSASMRETVKQDRPALFRIVGEREVIRECLDTAERPRWLYATRDIERALAPLTIKKLHLQRNQLREFLAVKKGK